MVVIYKADYEERAILGKKFYIELYLTANTDRANEK